MTVFIRKKINEIQLKFKAQKAIKRWTIWLSSVDLAKNPQHQPWH